jgi:N12 class adenine-specific DNA methylase
MRATGQKFHTDEFGRVMPDADEAGNPVFHESDKVDYTPEGRPVRTQVDKTGVVKMSDPDAGAPIGGADNDPGMLYKQNKYQPWSPIASAYDLKDSQNIDPAIRDAAVKVAKHGEDAMRKSANEGISDIEAKASLAAASSKAESEDLSKAITEQNTQLDQQNERAGKTEGGSWFFNMGAKPTADAVVAKSQADKTQAQLAALEKQREEAAQRQIAADAESKRVKTEGDILKATNQLSGYEAAEAKRREMLIKAGKAPEEIDADPMISAIAKKRQEVGLDKSNHEQQRMVMQTASEAAARSFAADAPTREDLAGMDKSFMEKKGVFDEIQRQYTAESERLKKGIFTNSEEASASRSRLEDLAKQMQVAGANANAMLQVRNAAVQAINSPAQSTTPKQGTRSIDVSVGPDMQLSFKDNRDLTQTAAATPQTGGSQPASPAGATPQGQAGSLSQKKNDLKGGIMPYQRQIIDERNEIMRKKMEIPEDWGSKTAEEKKTLVEEFQSQKDSALAEYDAKKSEAGGEQSQFIKDLQGGKSQSFGEALKDEFAGRIRAAVVAPYAGVQDVSLGLVETLATAEAAATGKRFEDTTLGQFAAGARQQTAEAMGDKADSITAQIMRGAGSSVAFMAAGSSMPAIATVGALSAFGGGYREALEMGATGAKAYARAAVSAGLGATEAIPISRMFDRLEKVVPGSVKKFLVNTGAQFIEEGGQEFAQGAIQGIYDKLTGLSKDDWGKIFGEAAEAGAIAGFTGLLFAGTMNAANIRSQRKAATEYSAQIDNAITSYDQSGGTNARISELGNQWRSLPTIDAQQGVPQPEQYAADQRAAEAVTSQLPEGSPAVRPEQIAFARQIAPVFSGKAIADMQTQLSAMDAKVAEARQKASEAGVDGGFFKGTDYEAQGIALEQLGSAINERADFLNKMQGMAEEASQRSILSVQAAQEILAMPNAENRSMATGLVKIASGLDQNLLTGSEREMLLRPRKVTTPDPATGAPVTQTLPPLVRMEQGQMVITDEAISWMGNNAPISENLIPLDETARLKEIYSQQEAQNAQTTGTTDGSPATAGATGEGEQPIGNAPGSNQGTTGGIGQGSEIPVGTDGANQGDSTGAASPFAPSGDSQSEQRRKINATRLNPAVPTVIAREARGIASGFREAGKEVGLEVEEVPKDKAGNSGALVTFTDDGRIIFMHNPAVMARNASASNGMGKTTEGNASEYLHSMFGEEGLHFGWFSHLRDQWNAKTEEGKGTFSSFVHEETRSRFEDMRGNLANIGKTPVGIELSKAVIGAYNNYYGEESRQPIGDGENEASGNAVSILDRLSNQTDPNSPENAFNFMNEFARQLAQMRVEGRVTESADANGFFEAMMKYLRSALDALKKVAGNTKNYDAGLDEMVSSMETRYADIQALMGIKPEAKAVETQESTENRQKQPESTAKQPETATTTGAESVTETVRLRQENNRLKAEQEERKAAQERAKARQGNAKEQAAQIDASTMEGVNQGRPAIVTAANNEQLPSRYVTLPAGVVQTSHTPVSSGDGSPAALFPKNPNYGGENTRPYDTDATEQGKVNSIAMPGALIPDEIINNSPSAAGGPPQIARVTFTDAEGNTKTVFQTAGGNGREMGINLSSQEDQARLSDSLRQSAGVFGLQNVPEGHRVYRFLGDYDLRNPEEARAYQQMVDKLNPSQGKIQGTTQRAKIDANIKIPPSTLSTLTMDTDPSDAQQIVRKLINDKSLGLDRNLMEATASDPVQSQQYVQQLVIASGLKSDKLNEVYFDLRGDTASNPARSTMRALIGGTAELGVKLRQKNSPELADSLAAALERVNSELERPKNPLTLKQALLKIAAQQENDALTQGAGGRGAAGADVQAIAKALLDNVKTGTGGKLSASVTQENFAALLRDINLAVNQQTDEADIFGETLSVSDLIKIAIENNNRRRGIVGKVESEGEVDGNAVAAKATFKDDEELKAAITEIHNQAQSQAPKFLRDIDAAARGSGVKFQSQYSKYAVKKLDTALSKIGRKAAIPSDLLRATVVSDKRNPEGVVKDAMRFVESMFNAGYKLYSPNGAIDFTNRFDMPEWDYKDVAMKFVRDGDSVVKEVLMLQPTMLQVKQEAHDLYDVVREIERRLSDKKNPMKDSQVTLMQKVLRRKKGRMRQLYKYAYKKDNQGAESRYSLTSSMSSEARYLSDGVGDLPASTRSALSESPSGMSSMETPSNLAAFSTKDLRSATDRGFSLIRSNVTTAGAQSQDAAAARRSRFQDDSTADLFSVGGTETTPESLTGQNDETNVNTEAQNNEQPNTRRGETDARRPEPAGTEEPTQIGGMGELFSFMAGQQSAERDFESAKSEAELPSDAGQQNDPVTSIEGADGRGGGDAAVVPVSEGVGGSGRGADAGRPARKGRTISQAGTGVAIERPEEGSAERNISLNRDQRLAPKGVTGKLKANLAAIRIIKALESEGRLATPEEKQELVKFSGWGALSQSFDDDKAEQVARGEIENLRAEATRYEGYGENAYYAATAERNRSKAQSLENWKNQWGEAHDEIKSLLSDAEYNAAKRSTINAHYTSAEIVAGMWDAVRALGFEGGNVLEPGAGIGHFFGLMPSEVADKSRLFGVELDRYTSKILKALYPEADIQNTGFQTADIADNSIDLAISNVPFANVPVNDPALEAMGGPTKNLHDYFFGKTLTKLKPGGVMAFITSAFTMDKGNPEIRKWLAERADLVAAYRLPNDAFKDNAGTDVVTDVIILRKKDGKPFPYGQSWVNLGDSKTQKGEPIRINEYFASNPSNIFGLLDDDGSMYGDEKEMTVHGDLNNPPSVAMMRQLASLPKSIMGKVDETGPVRTGATGTLKFGNVIKKEGKYFFQGQEAADEALNAPENAQRVDGFITLRDALNKQYDLELSDTATEAEIEENRTALNAAYDRFIKIRVTKKTRTGKITNSALGTSTYIHDSFNKSLFAGDPDIFRLLGAELEVERKATSLQNITDIVKGKTKKAYKKADVFSKRVLEPRSEPTKADTIEDAYGISLGWRNRIDTQFIAGLIDKTQEQVEKGLLERGIAFQDPSTGQLYSREQYISGNVRKKLQIARASGPAYQRNVDLLEGVQPQRVGIADIKFKVGATWIPSEVYTQFLESLGVQGFKFIYKTAAGSSDWAMVKDKRTWKSGVAYKDFETNDVGIEHVMDSLLNFNPIVINFPKKDGGKRNEPATQAAREKAKLLTERFVKWANENEAVANQLTDIYNEEVNAHVQRTYDGQFLSLPWANKDFGIYPDKKNTIWRAIQEGYGLIAHGVGGGKTVIGTSIALEMRRLGMSKKPMIVVHNATLEGFAKEIAKMAPSSRILIGRKDELAGAKKKEFLMRIAAGDWDAVVIAHSTFSGISDDPDVEIAQSKSLIDEALATLKEAGYDSVFDAKADRKKPPTVKALVKLIEKLETAIDKAKDRKNTEKDLLNFQQLGVDSLIVDEVHEFKKIPFTTHLTAKGIDGSMSKRAYALFMRARQIQAKTGGKNIFSMTGTPVTNTLGEIWNMIRLVAPNVLKEYKVELFDQFHSKFAEVVTQSEMGPNGEYKNVERLAKFVNLPEWNTFLRQAADIKLGDDMVVKNRPDIKGGAPELVVVKRTKGATEWVRYIREVLKEYAAIPGKEKQKNPKLMAVPVQSYMASRAAAIDIRLIDPQAKDEPGSKVNVMIEKLMGIYERTAEYSGTQVIFADSYRSVKTAIFDEVMASTLDIEKDPNKVARINTEESLNDGEEAEEDEEEDEDPSKAYTDDRFNIYEDIREKLIARGVPAEQIAVITDKKYKTDKDKQALFDKVNSGEVRIIMGSTQKLGTGVNMQRLMITGHDLDVPWTPAGLEQRAGRVYRQGNIHGELGVPIELYRYGMEDTLDSSLWQKLVTKQRTSYAALSGKVTGRELEEDDVTLNLSEQQAVLGGKTSLRIWEIENRLKELGISRQANIDESARRATEIRNAKTYLRVDGERADRVAPSIAAMEAIAASVTEKGVNIEVGGETFKTKTETADAIKAALEDSRNRLMLTESGRQVAPDVTSISVNGLPLRLSSFATIDKVYDEEAQSMVEKTTINYELISRPEDREDDIAFGKVTSPATLLSRLEELGETIEGIKSSQRNNLENLRQVAEMPEAAAWPYAEEYEALVKELEEMRKVYRQELGLKEEEAKAASDAAVATEATATPVSEGEALKNNFVAAARKINSFADEQRTADNPDYQAALEAAKEAREALADYNIGKREGDADYVSAVAARAPRMQGDGFYSQLQRTIDQKMPNKASVAQIRAIIDPVKGSGVKPDEIKWSNLEGFLEGKESVTKQEVLEYLENEGAVKFEERTLSKPKVGPWGSQNYFGDRPTEPKYSQYALPGGENYREVVLTIPGADGLKLKQGLEIAQMEDGKWNIRETNKSVNPWVYRQGSDSKQEILGRASDDEMLAAENQDVYRSSHFPNIPNYVAHMRLDERQDASGKDGLFIEEIQSDRHQQGREKGYKENIPQENFITWAEKRGLNKEQAEQEWKTKSESFQQWRRDQDDALADVSKTPDAPFRKDWSVQMFKRALRDAIEGDKEWIGWTKGETQAGRYDLSKQVEKLRYFPPNSKMGQKFGTVLKAYGRNGDELINKVVSPEELPDVIGKEAAQRLLDPDAMRLDGHHELTGEELKVGGEGMKGFYDQILPKEIGKYVKKWGAKVEEGEVVTQPAYAEDPSGFPDKTASIWKVAITPEMRESIKNEGQAAFARSPYFASEESIRARDEAYDAAVKSGDEAEQQRLVDEAAKEAGAIRAWHGTDADFIDYDMDRAGSNTGGFLPIKGIFFSKDKNHSSHLPQGAKNKYRKQAYIVFNNPFIGRNWADLGKHLGGDITDWDDGKGDRGLERLKQLGNDGYILANGDEILVTDRSQIKSADPITRDDAGNVIPLSQRFNPESNNILFARSSYFGGLDSRAAQQVEDAFNDLDADSMLEQQAKAETQAPGQRTTGSPRLALGALNTQIMGVDEYRERIATTETQKQWQAEASAMLKGDYEGTRKRLIQAGMLGGSLTPAETKAAMMIVARETAAAATDPAKRAEVAKLIYAYRETGREEARSLSARRDMFMTPKERHREFLAKMIFSPGKADQAAIEKIESPAEREAAITAAVDRRMSEIEKALKAMGVTFDDILKGEVQISLIGSRVVENTLRGFSDKEQQALRMMQAGQKYENIAKTLGFSVSQVKAMRLKAVASIKKRHFDKVRKGLTVDDLKQDMNAVYARSPRQISEEAAEAEFARIIDALGFGENAGTGKKSGKKPFTLEDPIEVIKIARLVAATDKGALDMVQEYWMASLLSGITTHVANITGNTANAALDLTFQRGMETLVNSMVGDKDSPRAGEFKYLMSGLKGSMSAAFRAGIRAYDAEQSMVDYDLLGHELSINPSGFIPGASAGTAIKGKAGRVIRVPLRALAFMDDFSKTMVARMEVGAQAYRIGKANGYNGNELSEFIASEVETIGSQSWERAVGRATILAFQEKLRSLDEGGNLIEGGAVALNKGLSNYKPGKFFVPFINTVYNIFRTGVRKTPVGSASMLYKGARHGFYQIRNGKLNPHPYVASEFVRDSAEQVMAWALLSMMWGVVPGDDDDEKKSILITGSEPFQRGMTGLRDLSQRSGTPPYHIRIGDTLFNYGRIEPIATVLGTTADLVKAGKMARDNQSGSDILGYISSRILGQITDKTYGRGMSDIAGFIQDPKSMANWAATFASTFVPNILRQPMRAFDPYVRETSIETSPKNLPAGIAQRFMQSAVPMASVNQPRIDLYGNPVKKEGSAASRLLLPTQASPAPKVQPADRLFSNWNKNNPSEAYAPARASRRYFDPVTGEVKFMDDKTFQRFAEKAGKTFAATSRAAITPSMAKNPTEDDKDRVKKLLADARKQARKEVIMTSPRRERSLQEILFGSK